MREGVKEQESDVADSRRYQPSESKRWGNR
jgi:hypothetical protein